MILEPYEFALIATIFCNFFAIRLSCHRSLSVSTAFYDNVQQNCARPTAHDHRARRVGVPTEITVLNKYFYKALMFHFRRNTRFLLFCSLWPRALRVRFHADHGVCVVSANQTE